MLIAYQRADYGALTEVSDALIGHDRPGSNARKKSRW